MTDLERSLDAGFNALAAKIKKNAEQLKTFSKENAALKADLAYYRKLYEENKKTVEKYASLKNKTANALEKVEKIIKKIDNIK